MHTKPDKPYPDFPLGWHPSRYWCKRIRGKLHYFGPRDGSWELALEDFLQRRDQLYAGHEAPRLGSTTVRDLCNLFLEDREVRLSKGLIVQRTWDDYFETCKWLCQHWGAREVASLGPLDFTELLTLMKGNITTVGNNVGVVRVVFKYAYDSDLIPKPIKFGPTFKQPSKGVKRKHKAKQPVRRFRVGEISQLVEAAKPQMKAMILLGINAGLGNSDLAGMQHSNVEGEWLSLPRVKNGIERLAWLWPETLVALPTGEGHVFMTKYGNTWHGKGRSCPISAEFRKLRRVVLPDCELGFYALRHTFQTVADRAKDPIAAKMVMGHVDGSMSATYREDVARDNIRAVCEHVREWYCQ